MPNNNVAFQAQCDLELSEIDSIRNAGYGTIIAALGISDSHFTEKMRKLVNILDRKKDYILIDFSKHQPSFIREREVLLT